MAVNRRFAKKEDEKQADFIGIVAWDKTGEFCSKYFKKGQQVGIIGRLQTRQYDDKDGKRIYVTEVVAEEAYFADSKKESTTGQEVVNNTLTTSQQVTDDTSELPF